MLVHISAQEKAIISLLGLKREHAVKFFKKKVYSTEYESGQMLEEVAQRSCGTFIYGNTQKLTAHSTKQSALTALHRRCI